MPVWSLRNSLQRNERGRHSFLYNSKMSCNDIEFENAFLLRVKQDLLSLLIDPKYNWFFRLVDQTGYFIKKFIRDHHTTKTVAKHPWINLLIRYTIVAMYNDGSFISIGVAIIKSIKPE